jgi:2-hydroxychromene-2-carboxylate isomerase
LLETARERAMPRIDFWCEFASTYSYPAAMRIEARAAGQGVTVRWRPFLLGPLFFEQGWRDSPFNIYPVKGRYMWRDLERTCEALGLPLKRPQPFPQNSLLAARVALALDDLLRGRFSRAVYAAEFGEGRPIADRAVISDLVAGLGEKAEDVLARAESLENKAALKAACEEAKTLGLPGAPVCVTADGELFWGNDRLEQALDWATR